MSKTVLFIGEGAALAHVSRPLVLAQIAHERGYRVVFASDRRNDWLLRNRSFECVSLPSMGPARFLDAISRGAPLFDAQTLLGYVQDDLDLLRRVRPDLVVGDLRLSLSTSARISRVPYAAIANAYWSPYLAKPSFGMPPLARLRGIPAVLGDPIFKLLRPLAFAWHARPVNVIRRAHGLNRIPWDVRHAYTDADQVLYADVPEMHPLRDVPPHHRFIGPILWSPPVEPPAWWTDHPPAEPVVYLTLGSSGDRDLLPQVVSELAALPIRLIVATAGARLAGPAPDNVSLADYLPGVAAAARSSLVVCNGGAPTTHQALAAGKPVLGIASNMDQVLNMNAVEAAHAGRLLTGTRVRRGSIGRTACTLLEDPRYAAGARGMAQVFARYEAAERFTAFLEEMLG